VRSASAVEKPAAHRLSAMPPNKMKGFRDDNVEKSKPNPKKASARARKEYPSAGPRFP